MRKSQDLPPALEGRPLTAGLLQKYGVSPHRLRRSDLVPLGSGVYLPHNLTEGTDESSLLRFRAMALVDDVEGSWLSHATVCQLRQWPLPAKAQQAAVHLSVDRASRNRVRRAGVVGHRRRVHASAIQDVKGTPMSSPALTWLEVTGSLCADDLVVLGDHLVRHPYLAYEGRSAPYTHAERLQEMLNRHPLLPGRARALEALSLIRVGADSPAETKLRLALLRAGLPEPELQVPSRPGGPRADLGYPDLRIAIQYEGSVHLSPEQVRADQRRDTIFSADGWLILRFNLDDYRDGFRRAATEVRAAIAHRLAA